MKKSKVPPHHLESIDEQLEKDLTPEEFEHACCVPARLNHNDEVCKIDLRRLTPINRPIEDVLESQGISCDHISYSFQQYNTVVEDPSLMGPFENEIRDVPGYEGLYSVSNYGVVHSNHKYLKDNTNYRQLKPTISTTGYYYVTLCKDKKKRKFKVHQIVAMAFLGHVRCGFDSIIDHKNNVPLDNLFINLQITNIRHNSSKDKKDGTSKYTGVCWDNGKYQATIKIEDTSIHIGRFAQEDKAGQAYNEVLSYYENGASVKKVKEFVREKNYTGQYSRFRGVTLDKRSDVWVASIKNSKEHIYIGRFKDELSANEAYCYIRGLKDSGLSIAELKNEVIKKYKKKESSQYKYVYWHNQRQKWAARPMINGKPKSMGLYGTEEEAAEAVRQALNNQHD